MYCHVSGSGQANERTIMASSETGALPDIGLDVIAILPARGTGQRFGNATPKQFCDIFNQPTITYTIDTLERISWVKEIYIAIHKEWMVFMEEVIVQFKFHKVTIVEGGPFRHSSIQNCVRAVGKKYLLKNTEACSSRSMPVVVVHDAVRPFAGEDIYKKAAGAILPLVQTVLSVTPDGYMDQALNRSKHTASFMPQAFTLDVIADAYEKITLHELQYGTECLDLAWKYGGVKAKLVPAPDEVWKITYRKDHLVAEIIAREKSIVARVTSLCSNSKYAEAVGKSLVSKRVKYVIVRGPDDRPYTSQVLILENNNQATSAILNQFQSLTANSAFCKTFVVLLLSMHVSAEDWGDWRKLAKRLQENQEVAVYFVIAEDSLQENSKQMEFCTHMKEYVESEVIAEKAGALIASLLFERNLSMSGQVFVLP